MYRGKGRSRDKGDEIVLCAKKLVMATGGKQRLPVEFFSGSKVADKVMLSDYVLTTEGCAELKKR
jgi:hypothetical protein